MKIFLLSALHKYKRVSEDLDAKVILCNKSWQVFNNSGEKEIYIFQEDGSLIISLNGKAIIAKWSYISANDTVLISHNELSYMMKPFFNDDNLFVLQLDGTNEYSFLIEESKKAFFFKNTLDELELYIKDTMLLEDKKKEEESQRRIFQAAEEKRKYQLRAAEEELQSTNIIEKSNVVSSNDGFDWFSLFFGALVILYIFSCIMVYFYENPEGRSFVSVLINIKG